METGLNASACVGKQLIMVATASTEHPIGCKQQPIGCSVEAVLAFSPVSIQTQCTQRKRLRLDGNRASGVDHTAFTLQTHHTFTRKLSPDGATSSDCSHLITAYASGD